MRNCALAALALLLLAHLPCAAWVAVLYGDYPAADPQLLKFVPMPDGTEFSVSENAATYDGHYGNYTVSAVRNEHNVTLYLYGSDEGKEALEREFAWMGGIARLSPDICPNYTLLPAGDGTYFACNGNVKAYYEAQAALPPLPPSPSATGGGEVFPQMAADAVAFLKGAIGALLGAAPGGSEYKTAAEKEAAIAGAKAATQFCPLLAVALVVILAFLLVYARPGLAPGPVEPQIQKLLENETRQGIMQELLEADKVPTHLSAKLGVSKPAIVNRLAELADAGLVEKVEVPGRKFVHYRLTQKGRQTLLKLAS